MANSAASILRLLVASEFEIDANSIILSGEISPNFIPRYDMGHSWWVGAETCSDTMFGFHPKKGFVSLDDIQPEYQYSQNGDVTFREGETISSYLRRKNEPSYIFFLVHSVGKEYGETGQAFDKWTLYKSADFKKHWDMLEAKDIIRWEKWLNSDHIVDANEMV